MEGVCLVGAVISIRNPALSAASIVVLPNTAIRVLFC